MVAFLAFGRGRYDEPLRQIGSVTEDADTAGDRARERFADGLIELSLVPETEIVWVLRNEAADE